MIEVDMKLLMKKKIFSMNNFEVRHITELIEKKTILNIRKFNINNRFFI